MTTKQLTDRLQTHDPYLLSCAEAGMSEGPWERTATDAFNADVSVGRTTLCFDLTLPDARFIAATNGEQPWAELLWKAYQAILLWKAYQAIRHVRVDNYREMPTEFECEILLALDAAGRLGWKERV